MSNSVELIQRELNALELLQNGFEASGSHLIPDMVLIGFVNDVVECGHSVIVMVKAGLGRRAFSNARTAFEAMQQLLLLVTDDDYDLAGAKAWVFFARRDFSMFERHGDVNDLPTAPTEFPDKRGLELALAEITSIWNAYSPGKGELIDRADAMLDTQPKRRPTNWAGIPIAPELQRRFKTLAMDRGIVPHAPDHAEIYNATYSILSRESHPRIGFQPDRIIGRVNGPIRFEYDEGETDSTNNVIRITAGSVAQAVTAMQLRALIPNV